MHWVHSASTPGWSHLSVHPKRGRAGMDAAGVLPGFRGVAVRDVWALYDAYEQIGAHQMCAAHLLRELTAVTDFYEANRPGVWCWAAQVIDALLVVWRDAGARSGRVDPGVLAAQRRLIGCAAVIGATGEVPVKTGDKHRGLARRVRDRCDDYLRFATTPGVVPDNNPAEREVSMVKIAQKVSGCHRTLAGARVFVRVRSYLATAVKHGRNRYEVLTELLAGHAWIPNT